MYFAVCILCFAPIISPLFMFNTCFMKGLYLSLILQELKFICLHLFIKFSTKYFCLAVYTGIHVQVKSACRYCPKIKYNLHVKRDLLQHLKNAVPLTTMVGKTVPDIKTCGRHSTHVRWFRHHSMARPQVVHGGMASSYGRQL
jgi:hypothetical protein